jgi:FkbM family methyltransferase
VGVASLDLRDVAAFGIVNLVLGDLDIDANLYRRLEEALQPGDVFWDVGANVGFVSAYFARPGLKLSSLHAFEPNPVPLKTLQSLFSGNTRCFVHPFGLGDQDTMVTMSLSSLGSCWGTMARDFHEGMQIQVPVRRGDTAVREMRLPAPDVIKIDVEGFEPSVFAGLAETIAKHRPIITFEHIFLSDDQIKQLVPKGYQLYFIQHDGSIATDISLRQKGRDAIVVPVEDLARFSFGSASLPANASSSIGATKS